MRYQTEQEIREAADYFVRQSGHGALARLADEASLTPETIRRLRKGEQLGRTALDAVANALHRLGVEYKRETPQESKPTPAGLMADRLQNLSDLFRLADFPDEQKIHELIAFASSIVEGRDAYIRMFQKPDH